MCTVYVNGVLNQIGYTTLFSGYTFKCKSKGKMYNHLCTQCYNFTPKFPFAAFDLDPQSKTTTFCLVFCFNPSSMLECMYRRAEEFRSVTFFVATGRERREGSGQLGKCLGRKFSRYCLDTRESLLPSQNTAYQGKLGWIISTEVRARRRG